MSKEAMKLALGKIKSARDCHPNAVNTLLFEAEEILEEALEKPDFWEGYVPEPVKPAQQEPVAHAVIAGALFDFMGWLTSRKERLVLSSADNASPAVEAITEFAKMRGLSLDDAKVQDWNTSPPAQRTWVSLTDEQMLAIVHYSQLDNARAIEAELKEMNT